MNIRFGPSTRQWGPFGDPRSPLECSLPRGHVIDAMNRRLRFLAGVLTLAATTASFAETVWASVCAPMTDMEEMGVQIVADADAEDASNAMDCMLMAGRADDRDAGERDAHCPLNPAVGTGCSAVASLPSSVALVRTPDPGTSLAPAALDSRRDLLLSHALFHPPRA